MGESVVFLLFTIIVSVAAQGSGDGLSTGAIIGIVIGVVIFGFMVFSIIRGPCCNGNRSSAARRRASSALYNSGTKKTTVVSKTTRDYLQRVWNEGLSAELCATIYTQFDTNGSGILERKEAVKFFIFLHQLLKNKGRKIKDDKLAWALQCLNFFDKTGNGTIDRNEADEALKLVDKTSGEALQEQIEGSVMGNMVFNGQLQLAAKAYIARLNYISQNPSWKDPAYIENAAARYHQWLNVRHKAAVPLPMPEDINFMLMVHMLHPLDYANVMTSLFGQIQSMATLTVLIPDANHMAFFKNAWNTEYNEDIDAPSTKKVADVANLIVPPIATNLIQSATGQLEFSSKLLALADNDANLINSDKFLNRAVVDYRKFLYLKKIANLPGGQYLVPSVFIDLMWHAHMLSPIEYPVDCTFLAGTVLDHDDGLPDSTLDTNWKGIHKLWAQHFGEQLVSNSAAAYVASPSSYGKIKTPVKKEKKKKEKEEDDDDGGDDDGGDDGSTADDYTASIVIAGASDFNFDVIAACGGCGGGTADTGGGGGTDTAAACGAGACGTGGCGGGTVTAACGGTTADTGGGGCGTTVDTGGGGGGCGTTADTGGGGGCGGGGGGGCGGGGGGGCGGGGCGGGGCGS